MKQIVEYFDYLISSQIPIFEKMVDKNTKPNENGR